MSVGSDELDEASRGKMSQTMMRLCGAFVFALSLVVACGGSVGRTLPPPDYEEPRLPSWQPEEPGVQDPLEDALSGGQWVSDEPDGLGGAGAVLPPEPSEKLPPGPPAKTVPSVVNER